MNLIAAVDKNWGIGRAGGLLAHLPEDLEYFRRRTMGGTVIMGRKTFESLPGGRVLAGRNHIVLSRDPKFQPEGAAVCHEVKAALRLAASCAPESVFVIGGGEIYRELLPYCGTAFITFIDRDLKPDVYLVRLDESPQWRLAEARPGLAPGGTHYEFRIYRRSTETQNGAAQYFAGQEKRRTFHEYDSNGGQAVGHRK